MKTPFIDDHWELEVCMAYECVFLYSPLSTLFKSLFLEKKIYLFIYFYNYLIGLKC